MPKHKVIVLVISACVLSCLLLFVGQYVGGRLFASLQHIPKESIGITSLLDYWYAYAHINKKVKACLVIGFIVSALLPLTPLVAIGAFFIQSNRRSLHGDAKFAIWPEIKKVGLLDNENSGYPGVVVGKLGNRFLTYRSQNFISLAAPTRSGKGVGIVIPNLLSYPDSIVVLDIKLENWLLTAGFRTQHGQECYLFSPGNPAMRSHRWNPLFYINQDPQFRIGDIQSIASMLYPAGGRDTFFNENAQILFLGIVLYITETVDEELTMTNVMRLSTPMSGEAFHEWVEKTIAQRQLPDSAHPPLSPECIQALRTFTSNSEQTRANIMSTFLTPLKVFRNPLVAAATSGNDFDLRDVRKKRMTIYLGMSPDDLVNLSLLMNLFFSQLINQNTRALPENDASLKYQCLLLMDEFTALGRIQIIQKAVSYMAGYNLRLLLIFQNQGQITGRENGYGIEGAETLISNCAMRIMYQPKEMKDAKEYSEILGYQTVKSTSKSRQKGKHSSRSESESDQRRALMLPQELQEIGYDKVIIKVEDCRAIFADKIIYWSDPAFEGRTHIEPPIIPALVITDVKSKSGTDKQSHLENINVDDIQNQYEILRAIGVAIGFDFLKPDAADMAAA